MPRRVGTAAGTTLYLPGDRPAQRVQTTVAGALAKLEELATIINGYLRGAVPGLVDLRNLDQADRRMVDEALGEGEVGLVVSSSVEAEIQEATMAGLWRVRAYADNRRQSDDYVEVGPFPTVARRALVQQVRPDIHFDADAGGTMNVLPILAEVRDHARRYRPGDDGHVINLSNLPVTPEDLALIETTLGEGPVRALSRGYRTCRVVSTACRHVWRVMYFDAEDRLLVHMIEVVDVPTAVLATPEDMRDGARKLAETIVA